MPRRRWKAILIGFEMLLGRLAFSPSHTLPLRRKTRPFGFGLLMHQTLANGRAKCLNLIMFCGVLAGALAGTFLL